MSQNFSEQKFNVTTMSCDFGGRKLILETGRLAKQADGAVLVTYGETVVLVTAVASAEPRKGIDFLPLTVEFQEKYYAAGRIPGGFLKREGRPSVDATLAARTIDRPIRPLFPEGYHHDIQVVAQVLSVDKVNDPDVVAMIGASAALGISNIPFTNMVAACRVGRMGGEYIANPSVEQQEKGDLEILIAGTKNAIMMVEGGARQIPEEEVLQAILFGHREIQKVVGLIDDFVKKAGKTKDKITPATVDHNFKAKATEFLMPLIGEALSIREKQTRYEKFSKAKQDAVAALIANQVEVGSTQEAERLGLLSTALEDVKYQQMRENILAKADRIDGRNLTQVRPISVETGLLPRTHGSALFTRGETQVLCVATLGTGEDEQMIDGMRGTYNKRFMLNYNFPPFSVGEVGRMGTPGRREIGHGTLAERALTNILPGADEVPYTIRLVCEVLESNGSSSMGSVCSGSMALMDAGVKIPSPVAGIAMGLIKEGNRVAILSDILGDEDHLGDMDFKVAGTAQGVTAIQMDIKIEGVDEAIMRKALAQAHEGRMHILERMARAIAQPSEAVSLYAPRFTTIKIKPEKIRDVIGSGGKVIKDIIAKTGVKMDVEDDGTIHIAATDPEMANKALSMIQEIVAEPEIGKVYKGKVVTIVEFGAFVELFPGSDGLLHVSEIAYERVANVRDYLKEGDEIEVKVLDVDKGGKIRLSRKALLEKPPGYVPPASSGPSGNRGPRPTGSPSNQGPRRPQ